MSKAEEDQVGEAKESGEENDGLAVDAAKKKKRRSKKKSSTSAGDAEAAAEAVPEVVEAKPAKDSEGEEGDEDGEPQEGGTLSKGQKKKLKKKAEVADDREEEEADGAAAEGATAKKKKKKNKQKAGGGVDNNGVGVHKYIPDEEWAIWVNSTLEASLNGTEKTPKEELVKPPQPFLGYSYSGNLRPAFVTPQRTMPEGFLLPDYATDPDGMSLCERIGQKEVPSLDGQNLETMRQACRYGREVLDIAARFMKEGVTGDEIDRVVYQACVDRKIYPSPLNYFRFPKSICVSPNEVICHGIPDCRPIENGDIVNLDVSIYYNGYHSDLNETFFIGECGEEAQRVVRTAYCALHAACQLIRPGTLYRDLGDVIQREASKGNCAVVTTYCGHGVGELFHGPPKIPHYRKNKAVGIMKPGNVFTIEPMINIGSNGGDKTWPDDWTAVTKDGKRSAQFEHTFLVTETGVELMTARHGTDPTCMPEYDPAMFQR